jgi:F0F1-type ATP synthase membrane subunit b/b'
MSSLVAPFFNLAVLVGVLTYYLRAPLKAFVQTRHVSLRDEIQRVRNQLKKAQEENEEFSARLGAIDTEVGSLRQQSRQDAKAMKDRILAEATRLQAGILTDARAAAGTLYSELRNELYHEFGNRVLERAEILMKERLTGDDRIRIRQEFSKQVESVQ